MLSNHIFNQLLDAQDYAAALKHLHTLPSDEQISAIEALHQCAGHAKQPTAISIVKRRIQDDANFEDFYQSWFPPKDTCNPTKKGSQQYLQHFEVPLRVLNTEKRDDQKEIASIALIWTRSDEERDGLWAFIDAASTGENDVNTRRKDSVEKTANHESVEIYAVRSDDNLGTPF